MIPSNKSAFDAWGTNFLLTIDAEGAKLNEPAADIAAVKADVQQLLDKKKAVDVAFAAWQAAVADWLQSKKDSMPRVRTYFRRLKANPLYTEATGTVLRILRKPFNIDPVNIKPVLTVVINGGRPQIGFTKRPLHAIVIYGRIGGKGDFVLLATVTSGPFIDERPLTADGIPELREYYAMGLVNNKPVGQRSEVVSVMFAG